MDTDGKPLAGDGFPSIRDGSEGSVSDAGNPAGHGR